MRSLPRLNPGFRLVRAFTLALALAAAHAAPGPTVTIVDGVGRTLHVPAQIDRVYATSPVGVMMLYSLAPEKMTGWNYPLGAAERHFILPAVRDLPALGGWFGETGKGNRETLLAARPDVILSVGSEGRTAVELAERLQQQVGIAAWVDSGRLADTPETYERLGALLGVPERARVLADYARRALADARAFVAALPAGASLTVYYAEGMRGLNTDTKGSPHTELIDFLGLSNVAGGAATTGFGRIATSLDQVIAWRPDVILVAPEKGNPDGSWVPEWLGDPSWRQVPAVAHGRVYLIPGTPFNWFDRPPSAARLLGLKWLQWVLWPDRVKFDMLRETQEFYRLFFHYELGDEEGRAILAASRPALTGPKP